MCWTSAANAEKDANMIAAVSKYFNMVIETLYVRNVNCSGEIQKTGSEPNNGL